MQQKRAMRIGSAIGLTAFGLINLLPRDQFKIVDNIVGVIFLTFLVIGGAWAAFWWRRISRMRAKKSN